jgi:ferric-dicitrate binding protein FerR (iron transport regulator)
MYWPSRRRTGTQGPSADDIEQRAAEWLIRMDGKDHGRNGADLEAFLAQHPRHRAAFMRLSVVWRRLDALRKLAPLDGTIDADLFEPGRR